MNLKVIFIIIFIGLAVNSFANDDDPCNGPSAMHGGICVGEKLNVAKVKLDEALDRALARAEEEEKWSIANLELMLLESQAAWLKYREIHCDFYGVSTGAQGGWSGIHGANCKLDMIVERTPFLSSLWAG
jgi:uncharacterized protein YecT (DUF1311 family)